MIDQLVALFGSYGPAALAAVLAATCIGIPFPASLLMLAIGALAADGDVALAPVLSAGTAGAVAGDQAGYWIGRRGGPVVVDGLSHRLGGDAVLAGARAFTARWGAAGVFLTRWLVSPLGPFVNLASGAAGYPWSRFILWSALGEAVWVIGYVGLGFLFSRSVQGLADVLGDFGLFLAAGLVAMGLGAALFRRLHHAA